ncbi:hypothetical protein V8F06_010753 [Rhypophila decipiens]
MFSMPVGVGLLVMLKSPTHLKSSLTVMLVWYPLAGSIFFSLFLAGSKSLSLEGRTGVKDLLVHHWYGIVVPSSISMQQAVILDS